MIKYSTDLYTSHEALRRRLILFSFLLKQRKQYDAVVRHRSKSHSALVFISHSPNISWALLGTRLFYMVDGSGGMNKTDILYLTPWPSHSRERRQILKNMTKFQIAMRIMESWNRVCMYGGGFLFYFCCCCCSEKWKALFLLFKSLSLELLHMSPIFLPLTHSRPSSPY